MKRRDYENRFIEELERVHIISLACKNIGLSRQTVYRWMRCDSKFRQRVEKAIEMGIESVCDLAESKLISAVDRSEPWSIKFLLTNRHKDYKPKKPMSEQEIKFVPITTICMHDLTEAEQNEMRNKQRDKSEEISY